jgi:GNAT superfamily N-acetyltransferase
MMTHPRLLTVRDVEAATTLSTAAGWNQTTEDWQRLIELEPRGCFGIDCDAVLAATATLLCFDTTLAWIGMVLTHRDYMRRGFARALMQAAIDEARARGVRTIKLDATDQGHPLYASLGFIDEQPVERWRLEGSVRLTADAATGEIPWALDREAFGADRSRFIRALGAPEIAGESGYAMMRPGVRAAYLGPVVTNDATRMRIDRQGGEGATFWDLLPANQAARALAAGSGFEPVRHLVRMRLGPPVQSRDDLVFAIAGFEAG